MKFSLIFASFVQISFEHIAALTEWLIFSGWNFRIAVSRVNVLSVLIQISLKFISRCLIGTKSALVHEMAWHWTWPVNSYLPDKMAAILADDNFKCIFLNENDRIQIQIPLKFVPGNLIDNKPALLQVMAWRWTGDKPLPKPMLTQFTDAYMWH